jgi:hypothetical protein
MRFREYKFHLEDSLATETTIESRAQLLAFINHMLNPYGVTVADSMLRIYPFYGDPAGWCDTHLVAIDGYGAFGFIEGEPPR